MVVHQVLQLSTEGVMTLLQAAVLTAENMGVPQCISIVDAEGNLLASFRMRGSKFLSQTLATQKAITAASTQMPTGGLRQEIELKLAIATSGHLINLKGGVPIVIDHQTVGAIGVSSGSGEQDLAVATAAIAALQAAMNGRAS
jgi:glc operon protein GlcG